jgi:redox-sensing transcriptional repressor
MILQVLKKAIEECFGFNRQVKACLSGIGNLGLSIMQYEQFSLSGYQIVAAFDTNINRIETFRSEINLYPAYEMVNIIKRLEIELGIITVPADAARMVADEMIKAGITSIINFAPVIIKTGDESITVRNIDILQQFRILSAIQTLNR